MTASKTHKFALGTMVHLSMPYLGASGNYKIVRHLPKDANDPQYRVKSDTENYERVARESQLHPLASLL